MKCAADLHIHSCLSPCGEEDMTPGSIAGMAHIKGLDVIAVTDHNAARNLPAVERACAEYGIALLPGLECTSAEEVHALTYFPTVCAALAFEEALQAHRMRIPNRPALWGRQVIMNEEDEEIGEEPGWLIPALDLPLDELHALCTAHGGLLVPAHINRGDNGLLNVLGFLPPNAHYAALEVSEYAPAPTVPLTPYKILRSSDAHTLADIAERGFTIDCPEKTTAGVFAALTQFSNRTKQ